MAPTHAGLGSRRGVAETMRRTRGRAREGGCLGGDEGGERRAGPSRYDDGSHQPDGAWRFERSESFTRGSRRPRSAWSRRSTHSLAFLLCALLTLASATRAQSPEDFDGRQEGAVAVRALAPERGFVTGGLRVVVHGAGFTDALACQFGPHVVAPVSIHEDGTRMLCVAPPFANQLGGFVRVGVAIRVGGGDAASAASAPRGALTFAYEVTPNAENVFPRRVDASGGEILFITGRNLHVASACAFEPHPVAFAEKRFVSSALGTCEAPPRTPGQGVVALISPIASREEISRDFSLSALSHETSGAGLHLNDGGVAGLAVTAYRPGDEKGPEPGAERASGARATVFASNKKKQNAAEATLRAAAMAADETSASNAPTPVAVSAVPREGPASGGSPVFVAGADLSPASSFCLFRFGVAAAEAEAEERNVNAFLRRPASAAPGVFVSSALMACERPPAPAWAGALMSAHVEVGSPALGWSASGTAAFVPRRGGAATRVHPRRLPSEGGAETTVFSDARNANFAFLASCRFGTIGPVLGVESLRGETGEGETACVSPAMAPRREVRVYGSDPEASGSLFSTGAGTTARVDETDLVARDAERSHRSERSQERETERLPETSAFAVSSAAVLARLDALASAVAAGAAVHRVRSPESKKVPAEFGGAVALEGVFPAAFSSGAFFEIFGTQITCRFGSVAVTGRRIDGTSVECAAPSAKPGAKRVAVDGAAGDVALEHVARTFSSSSSSSSADAADAADFFGLIEREEDAFETIASPEIRGETRLVHYAGGSDVFADARGFVLFELSEPFFFATRRGKKSGSGGEPRYASSATTLFCAFDDDVFARARLVSSVSGTCDAPFSFSFSRTSARAGTSAVDAKTKTKTNRKALTTPFDARASFAVATKAFAFLSREDDTFVFSTTRRASFAPRFSPVVSGAAPSVADAAGGTTVALFGALPFDAHRPASLAWCRFGSLGPVLGRPEDDDDGFAGALACVAPARAPARAVPVTAFDAFEGSSDVLVAFVNRPASAFAVPSFVVRDEGEIGNRLSTVTVYFAERRAPRAVTPAPAGPAFDVLELSVPGASGFAVPFALETVDAAAVVLAVPSTVSADGGSVVRLAGARVGARAFGSGSLGGNVWCVFLDPDAGSRAATMATTFSSALAACESPPVRGTPSDALFGRVDAVKDAASHGAFDSNAATSVRGASFARVTPAPATAASPASADWLASPTVTLTLKRSGAASPLADQSSCWIGVVGPIRARRVSTSEVACVAPAHAGKRLAPVRLLSDLSAPAPFGDFSGAGGGGEKLAVAFTVSADAMDARGRPGGSRSRRRARDSQDFTPSSASRASPSRGAVVHSVTPRASFGGAPATLRGARFGDESGDRTKTWCFFEDDTRRVFASRATYVSGALARCAFSPLPSQSSRARESSGDISRALDVTVALAGVDGEPMNDERDETIFGAARFETRRALSITVVSATPRVVPASGGATIAIAGTGFPSRLAERLSMSGGASEPSDAIGASELRFGCRFGSVGPVAARHVSASSATCVSPASAPSAFSFSFSSRRDTARAVPVGFALDPETHLAETTWGDDAFRDAAPRREIFFGKVGKGSSATVLVDGASISGVSPTALAAHGTVAGGAYSRARGRAPQKKRFFCHPPKPRNLKRPRRAAPVRLRRG